MSQKTNLLLFVQRGAPASVPKFANVTSLLVAKVVNAPVDGFVAPMVVLLIAPPVIVTPFELKVLAVTAPAKVTVSVDEPILIASG